MFENVKKNFGFGCMRLPMNGGEVDYCEFNKMIDAFIESGFNYFDTAHGYLGGKSEIAIGKCLSARYPRDKFILTDKLTNVYFKSEEDIEPLFESQLKTCGVEYFDFYLMHAQSREIYAHFKKCRAYEKAFEFKKQGRVKHVGISFHDTAEILEQILTEYPQIEAVQIQLNYIDFDNPAVQSRKCLEVCKKFGKPAIVMEPVKGGNLVNLPAEAQKYLTDLNGGSNASYAIRFAAGLFVKCGIIAVYAKVLSKSGKEFLEKHGVYYEYETLTNNIINRDGTDICPMEKAVGNLDDPEEMHRAIAAKIAELKKN